MATAAATTDKLLTAEEFMALPDDGHSYELVKGRLVEMKGRPELRHGCIEAEIIGILRDHIKPRALGRVAGGDTAIVTHRNPDSVRGADVAYYSFEKIPAGELPGKMLDVVPELVFEVLSEFDRWPLVLQKVGEYLEAGVRAVCIVHPEVKIVEVYSADAPTRNLKFNDELTLPEILPDFRCRVSQFFE